jgi:hypothetical protein
MTKEEFNEREVLRRELNRFTPLQLELSNLQRECETERGKTACAKLMNYISSQITLFSQEFNEFKGEV